MNNELVSIIIPVYNTEKYLKQCVKSAADQTYGNLEILLVDDGSSDQSGILCDQLALEDNRIQVIHQENRGLSGARNRALDTARGEYLFFLDSDDAINTDTIEILHGLLWHYQDIDVAATSLKHVGRLLQGQRSDRKNSSIYPAEEFLYRTHCWEACGKLFRKKLFKKTRFRQGQIYEDYYLIPRLLYGKKVAYIENEMYQYLIRRDSIMGNSRLPVIHYDFARIMYLNMTFMEKKYGRHSRQADTMAAMAYEHMLERMEREIYPYSAYRQNKRLIRALKGMIRSKMADIWKNRVLGWKTKAVLSIYCIHVRAALAYDISGRTDGKAEKNG